MVIQEKRGKIKITRSPEDEPGCWIVMIKNADSRRWDRKTYTYVPSRSIHLVAPNGGGGYQTERVARGQALCMINKRTIAAFVINLANPAFSKFFNLPVEELV